ncbi:head-to-tail connector protein [Mycobacterium phage Journey13]|nr:head-to-tail connector protein [Mycobacterium phage Journey13]
MKIRFPNGGIAEVSDEFGARLIAAGVVENADKPARKPRARKTKTAPQKEPKNEE